MKPFPEERMALHRARCEAKRRGLPLPESLPAPKPVESTQPTGGPGTELRKMLGSIGIHPRGEKCKCNEHAHEMDRRGADWCEENLESILDWLEAEAKTRGYLGMLFVRGAARVVVRTAIARSRAPQSVGAP
jgi:hypothetical protein